MSIISKSITTAGRRNPNRRHLENSGPREYLVLGKTDGKRPSGIHAAQTGSAGEDGTGGAEAHAYGMKCYISLNTMQKFKRNDPIFQKYPDIRGAYGDSRLICKE